MSVYVIVFIYIYIHKKHTTGVLSSGFLVFFNFRNRMEKVLVFAVLCLLVFSLVFNEGTARAVRSSHSQSQSTLESTEEWGYVEVRPSK